MNEQENGQAEGPVSIRSVDGLAAAAEARARLDVVANLPDLLAEAFDAFELIRMLARAGEDQMPGLLVSLMFVADAAVDGREAVTGAPSLPVAGSRLMMTTVSIDSADAERVLDVIAGLSVLLAGRLSEASSAETEPADDRAVCRDAAAAAQQIIGLVARGEDDGNLR
jgi:hypothetical protein